ncbi:DNA repair protein RecO [Staphylococcus canis]|uniref:DNA repair protein RecO n=1 Tax=Staphylococcus canis TaxID=2724942 RepID=A0ABS0TAH0_9STAP|nr:DNA repair protein RecO [Staphylococcus canis]
MLVKQKGIIIKVVDYGESDKIITILNEYGVKVPLMVRRAKKIKSGLQATTQLFVYGLFIFNKWRGMGTLNTIDVIDLNYDIRTDIYINSYASMCLEIIDKALDDLESSQELYDLLVFSIKRIQEGISAQLISNIVLLKCMKYFGFQVNLNQCAITHNQNPAHLAAYSFKYNGIISKEVLSFDEHALPLSNKTIYLTNVLLNLPLNKINEIRINQDIITEMSSLLLMLYREYAGIYFKSQRLINQLKRLES